MGLGAVVGHLCGQRGDVAWGASEYIFVPATSFAVLAMLLGSAELAIRRSEDTRPPRAGSVCVAAALYAVGVAVWDPFLWAHSLRDALNWTPILAPLVVAAWYFVRARTVSGVVGVTAFLYVAAAVIAFKAHIPCTAGFITLILD
jgi:hypothetical protein